MNRRRIAKGCGLSVAVLLVVGMSAACTPDASEAPAPLTTVATLSLEETEVDPAAGGMTWADGTPIELVARDGDQAQPAGDGEFEETQSLLDEWENEQVMPMAMGLDDQILVTLIPEDNFDSATNGMEKHERVGILQGEEVTIFDPFRSGDVPRQTLSGDRVFWHMNPELDDGVLGSNVMSAALTGGDLRVEAEFSAAPVALEGGVAVLQMANDTATGVSMLDSAGAVKELINFGTTDEAGLDVPELVGDGKTLALVLDDAATEHVNDPATKDFTVLDTPKNKGVGICSGDAILWSSADGNGTTLVKW